MARILLAGLMATGLIPQGQWPLFRGDSRNSGAQEHSFQPDAGQKAWFYQTAKGIFSTAVIDAKGSIYVGSADTWFYSIAADGSLNWRLKTGEIIDSSAALSRDATFSYITVPSGDGYLRQLRLAEDPKGQPQELWKFNAAAHPHPKGKGYNWFEGNVAIGPDGNLYAGNTNWNFYSIDAQGESRWTFPAGNMNWSAAAFDPDGSLYTASLDFHFRKLRTTDGQVIWEQRSLGFNSGSLVLTDNQVIGTSFDHKVYALNKDTGRILWTFASDDHIYSSAAVSRERIYITSTDGRLYALDTAGKPLWSFDSHDVIRSSPVVNRSPNGRDVIYFGGGDGLLYAVDDDGTLRWAFDTNVADPYLSDRNDLNASPALSATAVVIGGEHGQIWSVPYDYPLLHPEDPRSRTAAPRAPDGIVAHVLTPGARVVPRDETVSIGASSIMTLKIERHENGQRQPGGINAWFGRTHINLEPAVAFDWQVSAAADTIFIKPRGFWEAGQTYRVSIDSQWMSRGLKIGAVEIGASEFKDFTDELPVTVATEQSPNLPWNAPDATADVFELRRLAVNQPSMMPSLNQIGFDSYHWLVSLVEKQATTPTEGRILAWVRGAQLDAEGQVVPGLLREFRFPMAGFYRGDAYILKADNVVLDLGGIQVKLKTLEFRGQLHADQSSSPMASFYAEPAAGSDWTYVPAFAALGLLNKNLRLPMAGTYLTGNYPSVPKPQNFELVSLCAKAPTLWREGRITAHVRGGTNEDFDFLVTDREQTRTLSFAEGPIVTAEGDSRIIEQIIPRLTSWPQDPNIRLMAGLYPLPVTTLCD